MARRRNREINIFNMSLLDILCGALGAFCFMMLALLPYYKPPGAETDRREEQRKTEELVKQVDEVRAKVSDPKLAEDLRSLVEQLRKQIQEMQGELNQALAKNLELTKEIEGLTARNAALSDENEELKELLKRMTSANALAEMQKRIEALEQQLSLASAANLQLIRENEDLVRRNSGLLDEIQNRTHITIHVNSSSSQKVAIFLQNVTIGRETAPFDPGNQDIRSLSSEDDSICQNGYSIYVAQKMSSFTQYRVFLHLITPPEQIAENRAWVRISYGDQPDITPPPVDLARERPWVFYGTLRKDKGRALIFTPATDAERDTVWEEITHTKAVPIPLAQPEPKPTLPDVPSAKPVPTPTPESSSRPTDNPKALSPPPPPLNDSRVISPPGRP